MSFKLELFYDLGNEVWELLASALYSSIHVICGWLALMH